MKMDSITDNKKGYANAIGNLSNIYDSNVGGGPLRFEPVGEVFTLVRFAGGQVFCRTDISHVIFSHCIFNRVIAVNRSFHGGNRAA